MTRASRESTLRKHEAIRCDYWRMYNDEKMRPSEICRVLAKKFFLSKSRIKDICTGSKS